MLEQIMNRPVYRRPGQLLEQRRLELDAHYGELVRLKDQSLREYRTALDQAQIRLSYLNPSNPLKRGYALIYEAGGTIVSSVRKVRTKDRIRVRFADGVFEAEAGEIQEEADGSEDDV